MFVIQGKGEVQNNEWRFLLSGGVGGSLTTKNPAPDWLTDKVLIMAGPFAFFVVVST
jgi:hypothetical protein